MDALLESERRKYATMWRRSQYHRYSPGLDVAKQAVKALRARRGESLRDYGCGAGLALDWFAAKGLVASGVDLVPQRASIIRATLWDLPDTLGPTDYATCFDVLEHLPPQHVRAAVRGIRRLTRKGAFMTVATMRDHRPGVGELHLTVQPIEWWRDLFIRDWGEPVIKQGNRDWRWIVALGAPDDR